MKKVTTFKSSGLSKPLYLRKHETIIWTVDYFLPTWSTMNRTILESSALIRIYPCGQQANKKSSDSCAAKGQKADKKVQSSCPAYDKIDLLATDIYFSMVSPNRKMFKLSNLPSKFELRPSRFPKTGVASKNTNLVV